MLFDHDVRTGEKRRRNAEAKRLCGAEIDPKLKGDDFEIVMTTISELCRRSFSIGTGGRCRNVSVSNRCRMFRDKDDHGKRAQELMAFEFV
jgi:hypothetical protein